MPKIKALDPKLISKIAAGQVVERPVSVVKELLENALDANASSISIDIENGGIDLIRGVDNGDGMDREDLLNCFLPHTTSKIITEDDLHNIKTLGFRGEALSSIAAVSDLLIKSKAKNQNTGYQLSTLYGTEPIIKVAALDRGTTAEVRNLFANVPARKKFLKSANTEYKHILRLLIGYALSKEDLSIRFTKDGKEIFNISKTMPLVERFEKLLGKDFTTNVLSLVPIEDRVSVHGFVTKPQAASYSTDSQYTYINGRLVVSAAVSAAIKDAYNNLVEPKALVPFVLYIDLLPSLVDVNVHPRKEEVRFWDDDFVYEIVSRSITETLISNDLTYKYGTDEDQYHLDKKALKGTFLRLKDSVDIWNPKGLSNSIDVSQNIQIFNTYILYQSSEGLTLIDQHAAHEAILYTQFLEAHKDSKSYLNTYILKNPLLIEFSLMEKTLLEQNLTVLDNMGFDITAFAGFSYKVDSIPLIFKDHDISKLIKEVLSDLQTFKKVKDVDGKTIKTLQFLSCRGAIKAGEKLTLEERTNIINKLEKVPTTYVCPHGRPIKIILGKSELERMFKRIK